MLALVCTSSPRQSISHRRSRRYAIEHVKSSYQSRILTILQTITMSGTASESQPMVTGGTTTMVVSDSLPPSVGSSPSLSSIYSSSSSIEPSSPPELFLIAFQGPSVLPAAAPALARRQASTQYYIGPDGQAIRNCQDSTLFSLNVAGQLFGNGLLYSTSSGVRSQRFASVPGIGNISTVWEDSYGVLQWRSKAFLNLVAPMCLQAGLVFIYFLADLPIDCVPISPRRVPRKHNCWILGLKMSHV